MNAEILDEIAAEVASVRARVGLWQRDDHTLIRVTGADAASWLQTQTTNNILALEPGQGQASAHLDRKGRLLAHFTVHRWQDEYWILVERSQVAQLREQLEAHLFLEDAQLEDTGADVDQITVQGPQTLNLLAGLLDSGETTASHLLPAAIYGCYPLELLGHELFAIRLSVTGEDGYLLLTQAGEGQDLLDQLLKHGACAVSPEAREILRIEAGRPRFGVDVDETCRIPETTLEREAVSYDKGCYVGQEVVARLKTYGSVKQALMGLVFEQDAPVPPPNSDLIINGQKVGVIKSQTFSPTLNKPIALAYLDRDHRTPGQTLAFQPQPADSFDQSDELQAAQVVVLPFYASPTRSERAESLYHEALRLFEADLHDQDDTAISLLQEAVLLSPAFEDAYEALGVILNRHHRVDEAIHYMRILADLNPDCVMAHTNLSVFYVAKGMIEEAETEKAKAAVLQIKRASDARKAEEIAVAERDRIIREAHDRIRMFEEVLEIDPDDSLATFGMGAAYMQLDQHERAVPYLERATRTQKDYSAAWLNLGKCLEFSGHADRAADAYRAGIKAATRKGDLMPLREMERRLKSIRERAALS